MKKFNLEEAKAGKPICTRDGKDVRIICWDANISGINGDGTIEPIVALIKEPNGKEWTEVYGLNGRYYGDNGNDSYNDLFIKEEQVHCCGVACGDNRFEIIEKAKEALLKRTNIESRPEEMAVLDNFLFRCWQMDWLEQYGPTAAKTKKPTLDDYTTIKTYEDACKALSIEPIVNKLNLVKVVGNEQILLPKHIIALMKLETISCALWGREWEPKPDADGSECYWYPWFALYTKREIKSMSEEERNMLLPYNSADELDASFGSLKSIHYTVSSVFINFRLFQETKEKAEYFSRQFNELWKEYLMGEK